MALKPVSDPNVLATLEGAPTVVPPRRTPVTDPAVLSQLEQQEMRDTVPLAADTAAKPGASTPETEAESFWDDVGRAVAPITDPIVGGANMLASGATNLVGKAAGGVAGLGVGLVDALTGGDGFNAAADTSRAIEQAATLPLGKAATDIGSMIGKGVEKVAATPTPSGPTVGEYFTPRGDVAESLFPALAEAATTVGPLGVGRKAITSAVESAAKPRPGPIPARTPVTNAREAGFQVRPSDAERINVDTPGRTAEKFAASDSRRDFTLANQKNANKLAAEDLGATGDTVLNDAAFNKLRTPHIGTYKAAEAAVKKVPLPEDFVFLLDEATQAAKFKPGSNPTITQTIGALRRRASKNIKSDVVATQDAGFADQVLADKLEAAFGKRLEELGEADMLANYQKARKALAKIHDVESATRAGQVDPALIFRINEKGGGKMTGRLKMIAEAHENFPDVTRSSLSSAGKLPVKERTVANTISDLGSALVRNIPGLRDYLNVGSEGFQNRLGAVADDARASYFDDYGVEPPAAVPPSKPPSGPGGGVVAFTRTPGVPPARASTLSQDLGLSPDDVPGAEVLPEAPSRLTADQVPRSRGDIEPQFDVQREANQLARDLGLVEDDLIGDVNGDTIDFVPPSMADQMVGNQRIAPPRDMEQLDLPVREEQPGQLQLTRPNRSSNVTHAVDKKGNHTVRYEGGGEIQAIALPDEGRLQIKSSFVPKEARSQGRAQAMVRKLMKENPDLQVVSDTRVSEPAQQMWAALEKAGVKIKRNPATKQSNGELISKSELKPVFEIVDEAEELGTALAAAK